MTENKKNDPNGPLHSIGVAKSQAERLRKQIIKALTGCEPTDVVSSVSGVLPRLREYSAAVSHVTSLEAEIEKHSSDGYGVIPGDAIDLDAARREVFDRIVRFRERSGD